MSDKRKLGGKKSKMGSALIQSHIHLNTADGKQKPIDAVLFLMISFNCSGLLSKLMVWSALPMSPSN